MLSDAVRNDGKYLRNKIKTEFWEKLQRRLTSTNAEQAVADSKLPSQSQPTFFLPPSGTGVEAAYYANSKFLETYTLPDASEYDDDFIYKIGRRPGILALEFQSDNTPMPYLVPGGRFNEFYGWDSYFIALGLINEGYYELASYVASHFAYEIRNYGKVLNANRPYFLGRTQPPFLTDLAWRLHDHCSHDKFVNWMHAAIQEYKSVWMSSPRLDEETHLSKYVAQGWGVPPEVELGHFDDILAPYASKREMSIAQFVEAYNAKRVLEPELDLYLLHDRSLRESGHDVSSRLVNCCADLVTIDLASLLYKYELDITRAVETYPSDFPDESVQWWRKSAELRRAAVSKYLWDPKRQTFGDYNVKSKELNTETCLSATALWALWSGVASREQASSLLETTLPLLEFEGGIAATSIIPDKGRQWDYPAGWAPHQILAWEGLEKYGFRDEAKRLSLKWISTIVKAANLTEGSIFEKYDVTDVPNPHEVRAEYGNQGSSETGFGWTNTSFAIAWDRYSSS